MQTLWQDFYKSQEFNEVRNFSYTLSVLKMNISFRHWLEQHTNRTLHECQCGAAFSGRAGLEYHQINHFEEKVTCEVCKNVVTATGVDRHWRLYHLEALGPAKKKVIATEPKERRKYSDLQRVELLNSFPIISVMILNHDGPFICDQCGSELYDRIAFFKHLEQKKSLKESKMNTIWWNSKYFTCFEKWKILRFGMKSNWNRNFWNCLLRSPSYKIKNRVLGSRNLFLLHFPKQVNKNNVQPSTRWSKVRFKSQLSGTDFDLKTQNSNQHNLMLKTWDCKWIV